jgi:O-antigen/teichoic acid export membrane protein
VPVFRFFGVGIVLWFFSIALGTVMTAMNLQREFSRASGVAAALVVPVSVGCIWTTQHLLHNGAIGAAISHIVIETYMLYRYMRALPEGLLPVRQMPALLGRLTASVLPLVLVPVLLPARLVLPALVPGLALYGLLCIATRCVTAADVSLLRNVVRNKVAAPALG